MISSDDFDRRMLPSVGVAPHQHAVIDQDLELAIALAKEEMGMNVSTTDRHGRMMHLPNATLDLRKWGPTARLDCKEFLTHCDPSSVENVDVKLNWHHIDTTGRAGRNDNQALVRDVQGILSKVASLPNLKRVSVEISSPKNRIRMQSAKAVMELLRRFPRKIVALKLARGFLNGGVSDLLRALRDQIRLEVLSLQEISSTPHRAHRWCLALLSAVTSLPRVANFHASVPIHAQLHCLTMANSLAHLTNCSNALTSLDLKGFVHCYGIDGEMVVPMLQSLQDPSSRLVSLDLSGRKTMTLSRKFFHSVGEMLQANTSLERLRLPIPDAFQGEKEQSVILPLIRSLGKNRSLKSLLFHATEQCPCVDDFIKMAISEVLRDHNFTLEVLWFQPINKFEISSLEYRFYLKLNSWDELRKLRDPSQPSTEADWIQALYNHSHDEDVVYFFLRMNPDLVSPHRLQQRVIQVQKRKLPFPSPPMKRRTKRCRMEPPTPPRRPRINPLLRLPTPPRHQRMGELRGAGMRSQAPPRISQRILQRGTAQSQSNTDRIGILPPSAAQPQPNPHKILRGDGTESNPIEFADD